jgi:hypothetical protein
MLAAIWEKKKYISKFTGEQNRGKTFAQLNKLIACDFSLHREYAGNGSDSCGARALKCLHRVLFENFDACCASLRQAVIPVIPQTIFTDTSRRHKICPTSRGALSALRTLADDCRGRAQHHFSAIYSAVRRIMIDLAPYRSKSPAVVEHSRTILFRSAVPAAPMSPLTTNSRWSRKNL